MDLNRKRSRHLLHVPLLAVAVLSGGILGCAEAEPPIDAAVAALTEGRSLDVPPDPRTGEWWRIEVSSGLSGTSYETTLVVTDRAEGTARFGMPDSDFRHDFLVLHIPPLGDIDLETFAWRVMWDDFEALRFPLEPGRTWSADFHGYDVEAEVTRVRGNRAYITMVGERDRIELVYDARRGMISELQEEALGLGFRVVDHGFDYEGLVKTPVGIELALFDSRPSRGVQHGGHEPPTSSVEVERTASHGSLGLVLGAYDREAASGTYRIAATAPDGSIFEESFTPRPGDPPLSLSTFGAEAPAGTWQIEFHREAPGSLIAELFVYDLVETRLGPLAESSEP